MHLHTSTSTDGVPAADRLPYFRDLLLANMPPAEVYGDPDAEFSAEVETGAFGSVRLMSLTGHTPGRRGLRRTPALVRRADPHGYGLIIYEEGRAFLEHDHRLAACSPGDMTLIDTSHPYDGWYESGRSRLVSLTFPRELLPLPAPIADRLRGARLSARTGVGALLRTFTAQAARDLGHYRPADAVRLSTTLLDLVGATLSAELGAAGVLPDDSRRRVLYERLQAFIEANLGDPALTPAAIAEAHHISIRTLHRLFAAHDRTVADWIRGRRLERCAGDLADPAKSDRPIHAVAARWGLTAAPQFSRAFRAAYGLSPKDYRRRAAGLRCPT